MTCQVSFSDTPVLSPHPLVAMGFTGAHTKIGACCSAWTLFSLQGNIPGFSKPRFQRWVHFSLMFFWLNPCDYCFNNICVLNDQKYKSDDVGTSAARWHCCRGFEHIFPHHTLQITSMSVIFVFVYDGTSIRNSALFCDMYRKIFEGKNHIPADSTLLSLLSQNNSYCSGISGLD